MTVPDTVGQNGKVYEVYTTKNVVIRYFFESFLRELERILLEIRAVDLFGLDIGCGEGYLTRILYEKELIKKQVAIDLDEIRIQSAKANRGCLGIEYLHRDIYKLDYKKETFDYVTAIEIFEHLPDPVRAIEVLSKLTKENGHLIVSVPHEPFFRYGNIVRGKYGYRGGRTPSHVNFWTLSTFEKFLKDFVVIEEALVIRTFPWLLFKCRFRPV